MRRDPARGPGKLPVSVWKASACHGSSLPSNGWPPGSDSAYSYGSGPSQAQQAPDSTVRIQAEGRASPYSSPQKHSNLFKLLAQHPSEDGLPPSARPSHILPNFLAYPAHMSAAGGSDHSMQPSQWYPGEAGSPWTDATHPSLPPSHIHASIEDNAPGQHLHGSPSQHLHLGHFRGNGLCSFLAS